MIDIFDIVPNTFRAISDRRTTPRIITASIMSPNGILGLRFDAANSFVLDVRHPPTTLNPPPAPDTVDTVRFLPNLSKGLISPRLFFKTCQTLRSNRPPDSHRHGLTSNPSRTVRRVQFSSLKIRNVSHHPFLSRGKRVGSEWNGRKCNEHIVT